MITAADPVEALRRCRETCFDLALLDYEMPSLTGSQLARDQRSEVAQATRTFVLLQAGVRIDLGEGRVGGRVAKRQSQGRCSR